MLSYIQLSKKPKMFKTFTGLSIEEFGSIFRNRLKKYGDTTSIVSGLINFKVMMSSGFDLNGFVA